MKKAASILILLCMALTIAAMGPTVALADEEDSYIITKDDPAVVIRASYATSQFRGGPGGVMEACPVKEGDCFQLYDVIIWEDRIHLYKFPNYLTANEAQGLRDYGKNNKLYYSWRESFCLASYSFPEYGRWEEKSEALKTAFIDIFQRVYELTPSENMIYFYSGHGTLGLCEMSVDDTEITLSAAVEAFGHKFALIDLGTNCSMSHTSTLQLYHPYAKYLMASQLDVGGFTMDTWESASFQKYNYDSQYPNLFREGQSVLSACKAGMDLRAAYWKLCRKNLTDPRIQQSVTLIDLEQYTGFFKRFNEIRRDHPEPEAEDIYDLLLQYGSDADRDAYHDLVIYYVDNNSPEYFVWEKQLYGITAYDPVQLDDE